MVLIDDYGVLLLSDILGNLINGGFLERQPVVGSKVYASEEGQD